jgi:hypothetical protein
MPKISDENKGASRYKGGGSMEMMLQTLCVAITVAEFILHVIEFLKRK